MKGGDWLDVVVPMIVGVCLIAMPARALFRSYTWDSTLETVKQDKLLSKCTGPIQDASTWTMECATLVNQTHPATVVFYFRSETQEEKPVLVLEAMVVKIPASSMDELPALVATLQGQVQKKYGEPKVAMAESRLWVWQVDAGTEIRMEVSGVTVQVHYLSPEMREQMRQDDL